jgi:hypothetical protein
LNKKVQSESRFVKMAEEWDGRGRVGVWEEDNYIKERE